MAEKKTKTTTKKNDTEKVAEKATVIIQPDGTKVSHIFNDKFDQLALAMYEGTLSEEDKAKLSQKDIDSMASYVRQGILQLDTDENKIQLNETQKKIRHLWFQDAGEDETREKYLGAQRYNIWKIDGVEDAPKFEPSPSQQGKMEEIATTINIETNVNVDEKEEKKEEENSMFNQNGQQAQAPQNGQQQGNILTDAIGAVDEFTDHWYGKAAIAGVAAFGTYKLMNRGSEDEDYSSAGADAAAEYGGNFF